RALARHDDPAVADLLLAGWAGYGPALRRETVEALLATPDRANKLLDAIEQGRVPASQLEPARFDQLAKVPDPKVRRRTKALPAPRGWTDGKQVVEGLRGVLELKPDLGRGREVFKKTCAACHKYGDEGFEVGPELRSAVRNKSPEDLLVAILDPNREVDPR